jgi:GR25 family glycosyltransferase involved in LPS biosynthesis
MNLARRPIAVLGHAYRFWLALRMFLPRQKSRTFGVHGGEERLMVERIYVINLDRETGRWSRMEQELRQILDYSGSCLLDLTVRHTAIDATAFLEEPTGHADIDPYYTLGDQLFVEPQPLALPTQLELDAPIRMSRAEIAVAQSHIDVWRRFSASECAYALILEDDVWFDSGFAGYFDEAWNDVITGCDKDGRFDVLYLSYQEVKNGAPKISLSHKISRPFRGLWNLSGYVISREGAQRLLQLLPCRGPVDLWINLHFNVLNVRATKRSIIRQRLDAKSTNCYSILPTLTTIGAITSEGASLFNIRPTERPVFAFGPEGSGLSSLAMALSMLGYRCCSDLHVLPTSEQERLLGGSRDRVFDAYVNIGSLGASVRELRSRYPTAKFILTAADGISVDAPLLNVANDLGGADIAVLNSEEPNKWKVICEHLRCAPPPSSFPSVKDLGKRTILETAIEKELGAKWKTPSRDVSPWVVEPREWWQGIRCAPNDDGQASNVPNVRINDSFEYLDTTRWALRNDTFTDNLALFRPSNIEFCSSGGAALSVRRERLGVRDYSAASICSQDQYLFGRFEATIKASNVPGIVTGFFLHRNSPRQEIDIEITGKRPDRLLVNVFYNPGSPGAHFDYGYRGSPTILELGFDASQSSHRFAIEWGQCEIRWLIDDHIVYRRAVWDPTPIPDLPMTLHLNIWPSRSAPLAGRINNRRLPATTIVESIALQANSAIPSASQLVRLGHSTAANLDSGQLTR